MNQRACDLFIEKLLNAAGDTETASVLNDPHYADCPVCRKEAEEILQLLRGMQHAPVHRPPVSIQEHFYQSLRQEMNAVKPAAPVAGIGFRWIAAACLLLIAGAAVMYLWIGNRQGVQPFASHPVRDSMTGSVPVVSLSERIALINTAADDQASDPKLVETLLQILETDKNANVRMAAFYALAKYNRQREVHDRLVTVLQSEKDPVIQVLLINLLTETKEHRALETIRSIINNNETRKEVKSLAQSKIKSL